MKVITKTDEYTIYQKRSDRYAIKNPQRRWINGDEKVAILLKHKLIAVAKATTPEPEPAAEAAEEAVAEEATGEKTAAEESAGEDFTPDADATR